METEAVPRRTMVGMAIACEGGLGLVALAVGWFLTRPPHEQFAWTAVGGGQGLLAAVPMLAALWMTTRWPIGPLESLGQLVKRLVVPMFRNCTTLDLLLISAAAGLGEELLFRGVVQVGIEQFTHLPWLAVLLAGALFGLAHPISTSYVVVAGLIGVYLGWLLVATGNLLVPIVAHGAYDFFALVYLVGGGETHSDANLADNDSGG